MTRLTRRPIIPLALIGAVLVLGGVFVATDTGVERDLKEAVGYPVGGGCEPQTDPSSRWRAAPALPGARDEQRAAVLDGRVYLAGGVTKLNRIDADNGIVTELREFTRFDPRSGRYTEMTPMPQAGNHVGTFAHDGRVYVLGGFNSYLQKRAKDRFSAWDPRTNRWSSLPRLPEPRGAMAVGVIDGRLIVAGGANGAGKATSRVDGYDFATRRWTRLADMPTAREHTAAGVVGGRLYVLGGRSPGNDAHVTAERYDAERDRWEGLPPMPEGAGGMDALVHDGRIFTIGGGNDSAGTVTRAVQQFDPDTGRWTRLADMRTPRHGAAAALVGDSAYAFGGSPCAYFAASEIVEAVRLEDLRRQPS